MHNQLSNTHGMINTFYHYLRSWTPQSDNWVYTTCGQQTVWWMRLQAIHYGIITTKDTHDVCGVTIPNEEGSIIRARDNVLALTEGDIHCYYWYLFHSTMLYQLYMLWRAEWQDDSEWWIEKEVARSGHDLQRLTGTKNTVRIFYIQTKIQI